MNPSLEDIWHEFAEHVGRFVSARVGDPMTAEDLRQEIFARIQQRLGQLRDPAKLKAWIYLIARNAIIDHYRARRETVEVSETIPEEQVEQDPDLEGLMISLRRMMTRLPEPYREALVLTEFEGLTQKELSEKLAISLSGAKSRVQRGRDHLRAMLHGCCTFEFDRRGKVIECQPRPAVDCPECERSPTRASGSHHSEMIRPPLLDLL